MLWRSIVLLALIGAATAASTPRDGNSCQACRSAVSFARKLNSTSQRQDYKSLVEKFCEQYYPASTDYQTGPCPMFADGFFFVLDNTDPVHHCDEIGACGKSKLPSDDIYDYTQDSNGSEYPVAQYGDDGPICLFCLQLLDQVKASLSNPKMIEMIRNRSDAFCSYLAVIEEDKACKQLTDQYLDIAVTFIKYIDSRQYCTSIAMCPASARRASGSNTRPRQQQLPTLADFNNFGIETSVSIGAQPLTASRHSPVVRPPEPECILCKTVVKEMFKFLRTNKTEAKIVEGLNQVCHLIYPRPGPGLEQCEGMVKAYTRELVEMLVDETDPDLICALLSLCVYGEPPRMNINDLISQMDPSMSPLTSTRTCIECKMFISYLRTTLENPKSEEEVKQWLLDNLCAILPKGKLQDTCTEMVESYSAVIFKAVAGDLNPQAACAELGACKPRLPVLQVDLSKYEQDPEVDLNAAKVQSCDSCVEVVAQVDSYLSNHASGEDITTLTKVCNNFLATRMRVQCNNLIRRNGLDIVQMIPNMDNPRQVCNQIQQC